jgi:hypothetical protein
MIADAEAAQSYNLRKKPKEIGPFAARSDYQHGFFAESRMRINGDDSQFGKASKDCKISSAILAEKAGNDQRLLRLQSS